MSDNGLITLASAFPAIETAERFTAFVTAHGMQIFARIDHAEGAAQSSMTLRPTFLIVFGHPKGGTPLMQEQQTAGIDLPLKALVWEDADAKVWLTYNDMAWIAQRHGLGRASAPAVKAIEAALAAAAKAATSR